MCHPDLHRVTNFLSTMKLDNANAHRRMGRGAHGLTKVSPAPALRYPSTPVGQATPKTADFSPLDAPRRTDL
jgi:hypothetical protein